MHIKAHLLAAVAALSLATGAQAYTVTVDTTLPTNADYFNAYVGNSGGWTDAMGNMWSGDGTVYPEGTGSVPAGHLPPSPFGAYMGVRGDETLTLKTTETSFSILWGSVDGGYAFDPVVNTLTVGSLIIPGRTVASLLSGMSGSAWVTVAGLPSFSTINFGTTSPAFEFSLPGGNAGAAPEPSTWTMLFLGFGGLGYAGYRRSRIPRLATIA